MEALLFLAIAAALGAVSVDLFGRFWLRVLGIIAACILLAKGALMGLPFWSRMHDHLAWGLLHGSVLILSFRVALDVIGIGTTAGECLAYFLGCLPRQWAFFKTVSARIDALFKTDRK
ncbi:hypothetical protein dsat_0718 [Alkalidesulfovibrio alkalitolerans DSM 16529]|jgi:hypothetical protein|uniref:Uncharacterized protein n=1 Tax=Alkalidesulfovibrio alkalitolerans DSM 16529 TaxID=1121439 RepID=S7T716_9BACT|nr:hypothetical protein [Alkalidesulfovibrio alkalitolerans]EPR32366.1 hypothetical protein dsat_0718 [Alkalidesulfovibrio alkalitolerans DSM 16529]